MPDPKTQRLEKQLERLKLQQKHQEKIYDHQHTLLKKINADYATSLKEVEHANATLEEEIQNHKKTQEKLKTALDQAEQANKEKSAFLAAMSHEIRTPLNVTIGMIGIALEYKLPFKAQKRLFIARDSSHHLQGVINNILDFSKIEAGKLQIEETSFRLADIIQLVMKSLEPQAMEKGLDFKWELSPELENIMLGDPFRIRQILFNLVGNAVKFTKKGHVELVARHKGPQGKEPKEYCIAVSDTGTGIPESSLNRIFERFSQAGISISRQYGGTGLGLAISQNLAQMMGGKISVCSTVGKGSTFQLILPYHSGELREIELQQSLKTLDATPIDILLVEDHLPNADLIAHHLKKWGHTTTHVVDGEKALDLLNSSKFDVVLMDIEMPGMSGVEVVHKIRNGSTQHDIPIICVTAHVVNDIHEECMAAGANAICTKPIDYRDLLERLARLTAKKESSTDREGSKTKSFFEEVKNEPGMRAQIAQVLEDGVANFEAALNDMDFETIGRSAHHLLNSSVFLGEKSLSALMKNIEAAAARKESNRVPLMWADALAQIGRIIGKQTHNSK